MLHGRLMDYLFVVAIPFIAYGIASWSFRTAFIVPILGAIVYSQQPLFWQKGLSLALKYLPPIPVVLLGIGAGVIGLTIIRMIVNHTSLLDVVSPDSRNSNDPLSRLSADTISPGGAYYFGRMSVDIIPPRGTYYRGLLCGVFFISFIAAARMSVLASLLIVGKPPFSLPVIVAVWVALLGSAIGITFPLSIGVTRFIVFYGIGKGIPANNKNTNPLFGVAFYTLRGIVICGAAGAAFYIGTIAASVARFCVASVAQIPINSLIYLALLVGVVNSATSETRRDIFSFWRIVIILVALSTGKLGWSSLYLIPAIALSYYRILPETLVYSFRSLSFIVLKWLRLSRLSHLALGELNDFGGELGYLPIPYHAEILAHAFYTNPIAAFPEVQRIRSLTLPGYKTTTRKLLPLLVADQLNLPKTSSEAIRIFQKDHPFLPRLFPRFYDEQTTTETSDNPELDVIFPRFQAIATDLSNALNANTLDLRKRGLDHTIQNLKNLQRKLPNFFRYNAPAVKRWTPVILHWERLIQLDLQDQKKLS
jgi:hypothetical protein